MNPDCCEEMRKALETLRKHGIDLVKIDCIVCGECKGSGEFGLVDGEVPCASCGGSGDALHPGIWSKKTTAHLEPIPGWVEAFLKTWGGE